MRTFLAVPLKKEVLTKIGRIQRDLAANYPEIRWVSPETMHLTIKFLGDVSVQEIKKIKTIMASLQPDLTSFETEITGMGAFPSLSRPRVIWLGVQNQAAFKQLHTILEEHLNREGFPCDERPFCPHLTLGRVKKPISIAEEVLKKYRHISCGNMPVDKLVLFESRLNPKGAVHVPLLTITSDNTCP